MNEEILSNSLPALESVKLSISSFIFSIVLSFVLSFLLSRVYKSQSHTLSNPETLARIFPLLSIATTIVIAVVKSSLALSLGLVGALSIVRFRTPIKEPEELTYIFLCIGIGLATGADQYLIAVTALLLTAFFAFIYNFRQNKRPYQNIIRVSINGITSSEIETVISIVKRFSKRVNFNNMSISNNKNNHISSLAFSIEPFEFNDLNKITTTINKEFPTASITFLDNKIT